MCVFHDMFVCKSGLLTGTGSGEGTKCFIWDGLESPCSMYTAVNLLSKGGENPCLSSSWRSTLPGRRRTFHGWRRGTLSGRRRPDGAQNLRCVVDFEDRRSIRPLALVVIVIVVVVVVFVLTPPPRGQQIAPAREDAFPDVLQ